MIPGLVSFFALIDTNSQKEIQMILKPTKRRLNPKNSRLSSSVLTISVAMIILLLVSACGSSQSTRSPESTPLPVVTTTALLADLVKNLGGDLVAVTALVPPGADVHSFQSTRADNIVVNRAALLVSNGGGLDQFLDQVIEGSASDDALHIFAAESLLDSGQDDPHFWQNPVFAVDYAQTIRDGLMESDPENSTEYQTNFDSYKARLTKLDFDIASTINTIDESRRHLMTFHDAFGHFAERYGWQVTALVDSDASQVSPGPVVEILEQVKAQGIPAVFAEPQFSAGLLQKAAEDAGIEVGTIYSDVQDGEAATYIDMMLFNAKSLARLLR